MRVKEPQKAANMLRYGNISLAVISSVFLLGCGIGGWFGPVGEHALPLPWSGAASLPAGRFIVLFILQWVCCMALLLVIPRSFSSKQKIVLIFGLALAGRLLLLSHEPSDDVNRYLWEGRVLLEGFSPYHHAPDSALLAPIAMNDPFHGGINHLHMTAAYPPLMISMFAVSGLFRYHPLTIKALLVFFDMGTLAFLVFLLAYRGLDMRWLVLYAFNPVILYAFAGQGHFDVMQGFFVTGSLVCYDRKKWGWMFLMAGLACQVKYVAALAIPFLVNRKNLSFLWIAPAAALLPYGFLLWRFNSLNPSSFFKSLYAFGAGFAFNGSVHGLLRFIFGDMASATMVCAVLLALLLVFGFFYFHPERTSRYLEDPVSGIFYVLGCTILFSPTVHFWYLSWIVPFLVLRPSKPWLVLCLTISFYFVTVGIFHHMGIWRLPVWAFLIEWFPFVLPLTVQVICFLRQMNAGMNTQTPTSVSVVIPVLNEAPRMVTCVRSAMTDPAVKEVIVVDGGSMDRTCEMALFAGARVLGHCRLPAEGGGRGGQIWAGIKQAKGDLVAVVHADSLVKAPAFSRMCRVLAKEPRLSGGALGSVFENQRGLPGLIGMANDLRMVFMGISFGDQVQFFRREPVVSGRIFPRIPLMEDVEFCIRLYGLGPQIFLFGSAVVSSRRWKSHGFFNVISVMGRITRFLLMRLFGRMPDTGRMYERYYGKY